MGQLIGSKGKNLQALIEKSGVLRVLSDQSNASTPVDMHTVSIIGSQEALARAKVVIDAELDYFKQREHIDHEVRFDCLSSLQLFS